MEAMPNHPSLDEDMLAEVAPYVRAEVFRRLERLWNALEPYVDGSKGEDGVVRRPDPRLMDAAVRVLWQLGRLARLDAPSRKPDEIPAAGPDVLEVVARSLAELEARMGPGPGAQGS
jgi:hypothetical protein